MIPPGAVVVIVSAPKSCFDLAKVRVGLQPRTIELLFYSYSLIVFCHCLCIYVILRVIQTTYNGDYSQIKFEYGNELIWPGAQTTGMLQPRSRNRFSCNEDDLTYCVRVLVYCKTFMSRFWKSQVHLVWCTYVVGRISAFKSP